MWMLGREALATERIGALHREAARERFLRVVEGNGHRTRRRSSSRGRPKTGRIPPARAVARPDAPAEMRLGDTLEV